MQAAGSQTLVNRMIGAAKLDVATYEEVERDPAATSQALIVVVLAGVAAGIGSIREDGITGLIGGAIIGIIAWAVFSYLVYVVGTKLLATATTQADTAQVMRALGFAYSIQILAFVGFIPVLGPIVAFIVAIWALVASVVAIRQALEMSTGRAIATAIIACIPMLIVVGIIAAIFNIGVYGTG